MPFNVVLRNCEGAANPLGWRVKILIIWKLITIKMRMMHCKV